MDDYASSNPDRLLAEARQGRSVGRLLELYRGYLKVLTRMQITSPLQGKLDASDVVQETFLQAHVSFRTFQGENEQELLAWLRRILARVLAEAMRRYYGTQQRNVRLETEMDARLDQSSQSLHRAFLDSRSTPSERAARREQSVLLANALEQLPDDYRKVIILRHLDQLSFPEIAKRMDRSLDSVKNLWTRSLVRLQQLTSGVS